MKKGFRKDTGRKGNMPLGGRASGAFEGKTARRALLCLLMALICIGAFRLGSLYWWGTINAEDEFEFKVTGLDFDALDAKLLEGVKVTLAYQPVDAEDTYQYEEAKSVDQSGEVTFALAKDGKYQLSVTGMLGYQDKVLKSGLEIDRNDSGTHSYAVLKDDIDQISDSPKKEYSVSVSWNGEIGDVMIKSNDGSSMETTTLSAEEGKASIKTKDLLSSTDSVTIACKERDGYGVKRLEVNGVDRTEKLDRKDHGVAYLCEIIDFIQRDASEIKIKITLESTRPEIEIEQGAKGEWTKETPWKVSGRVKRFVPGGEGESQPVELPIICLAEDRASKDNPEWKKVAGECLDGSGKPKDQPYDAFIYSEEKEFALSFGEEGEKSYWLYAVVYEENQVKDISAPKKITLRIDKSQPRELSHAFFDAGAGNREVHAQRGNGIFWNYGNMRLEASFQDGTSGVKEARLYCDGKMYGEMSFSSPEREGSASFVLEAKDFQEVHKLTLELEDAAGNVAKSAWEEEAFIKSVKPVITLELPSEQYLENEGGTRKWYRCGEEGIGEAVVKILPGSDIQIDGRGNIADEQLDLRNAVSYRVNNGASKSIPVSELKKSDSDSNEGQGEGYSFSFLISKAEWSALKEGRNTVAVTAGNTQGEGETVEQEFYIDDSVPSYAKMGMKFTEVNSQDYGSFANKKVEIAAYVADAPRNLHSGIREVRIYEKDADSGEETVWTAEEDKKEPGRYCVLVPQSNLTKYHKIISTVAEDRVGNVSERFYPDESNSNIKSAELMYEMQSPDISMELPEGASAPDGKLWYGKHEKAAIRVSDADSGLRSVTVIVNGKILGEDAQGEKVLTSADAEKSQIKEVAYGFYTNQAEGNEDGSYHISVRAIDQAGNVKMMERTVYLDLENPQIVRFRFAPENGKAKDAKEGRPASPNGNPNQTVEVKKYGFYFKKDTRVTVYAEDAEPTAGIRRFIYYMVDQDGKYVDRTGKPIGAQEQKETVVETSKNHFSVTVEADFKGRIFARVEDRVRHISPYRGPDGTVVESMEHHRAERKHIAVKQGGEYKDITGTELSTDVIHDESMTVPVRVRDDYAGIQKIEWWVTAAYDQGKNESGTLLVDREGKLKSSEKKFEAESAGWNGKVKKGNLVTQLTKKFQVKHNSNDVEIKVRMTDWAGNVSRGTYKLSIDTVRPEMRVTFDNQNHDSQYREYFRADRTATVEIWERNFDEDNFDLKITNTDGAAPKIGSWTTIENKKNPDRTVHRAKVRFSADGDYTLSAKFEDEAGNQAASIPEQKFTIDKTLPAVRVAYSAGEKKASNGNYFSGERTATITIQEHNFDVARVQIKGAASEAGKSIPFPAVSNWSNRGDTHVATIRYADNGKYSFDIAVKDKAGNDSAAYPQDQFFVDQKKPDIRIENVQDGHAYNGKVSPIVTCTDTNYDEAKVRMKLEGENGGEYTDMEWSGESVGSGRRFVAKDLPREKKMDDLYTLTVWAEDRAGNQTEKKCEFSVNRFGSVYVFSDDLNKQYVKEVKSVEFQEINVSPLDMEEIDLRMTKNGMPRTLKNEETAGVGQENETSGDFERDSTYRVDKSKSRKKGEIGWTRYTYSINPKLFQGDGKYTVAIYSKDEAGNDNENVDRNKQNRNKEDQNKEDSDKEEAEIIFGVDHTQPLVMAVNFEEGGQYDPDEDGKREMKIVVKDNLVLRDSVRLEVDGKEVEGGCKHEKGDDYSFQLESKDAAQDVTVTAWDQAGNEKKLEVKGVLVSTNPMARWLNNKTAFRGTVFGALVLAGGILTLCIALGKKGRRASA